MSKKYIPIILTSLLLFGCVQGPNVSEENALEVAVDDSNVDMAEVTSSDVKKSDGVFKVEFSTESGKYTYTVGSDGLVQDRKYEPGAVAEQELENKKESIKNIDSTLEENIDDKQVSAENSALDNIGLTREEISSITSELSDDQTQYTVVIVSGDTRTTCVVDANTGEVVSAIFE